MDIEIYQNCEYVSTFLILQTLNRDYLNFCVIFAKEKVIALEISSRKPFLSAHRFFLLEKKFLFVVLN